MRIDPWSSELYDYNRLREEFGISEFDFELPNAPKLLRRGVVFGHRGFETIFEAIERKNPFVILTGLAPSGSMHLGHKMTVDQVVYYQSLGADISLVIADLEAYAVRGMSLEKAREIAIDEYVVNYIALGLKPENCHIYAQSKRKEVTDLAVLLGRKATLSEAKGIYGFEDSTSLAHFYIPLIQAGDILHPQLERFNGPRPTLVPVGVDQDPHLRFARDLAFRHRLFNVTTTKDERIGAFVKVDERVEELLDAAEAEIRALGYEQLEKIPDYKALYINDARSSEIPLLDETLLKLEPSFNAYGFYLPSATYHRLMTGLTGEKMSSSKPETAIFLTDSIEAAEKKIKNCKTGGAVSLEAHKRNGGKPEMCTVYELDLYHFVEDDKLLKDIYDTCTGGTRFCGPCKKGCIVFMKEVFAELHEKRELAKEHVNEYLAEDTKV